jgi:putative transposase
MSDPLTDVEALGAHVRNWKAMLHHGLEASDVGPAGEAVAEAIDARLRTGRPLAADEWIRAQEKALNRKLAPGKRGPKPASREPASGGQNLV